MEHQAFRVLSAKLPTAIQKVDYQASPKHGWFFLVGSIPGSLCEIRNAGRFNEQLGSKFWPTLEEACKALETAGIPRYQLPDCSWNKET